MSNKSNMPNTAGIDQTHEPKVLKMDDLIASVGDDLSSALNQLVDALPDAPYRPQELARALGVNKDLSSRMLNALDQDDPLALVYQLPGPVPLRRLVKAAQGKGVAGTMAKDAHRAIDRFELLIRDHAGDRASLDAIIAARIPESREKLETVNRQLVYRGMAQLKGVSVDVTINTAILSPSKDGEHLDGMWLVMFKSLRRIRPNTPIRFHSRRIGKEDPSQASDQSGGHIRKTLTGHDVSSADGLVLSRYCSEPLPEIRAQSSGDTTHYMLVGDEVGLASEMDIAVGEHTPSCIMAFKEPGETTRHGPVAGVLIPTKLLVFDVLVHKDAFMGDHPELLVYEMGSQGLADMNDPARDGDRIQTIDTVVDLGWGLDSMRIPEARTYTSMLRESLKAMSLDERNFRVYRCQNQYPVFGTQYSLAFTPREKA